MLHLAFQLVDPMVFAIFLVGYRLFALRNFSLFKTKNHVKNDKSAYLQNTMSVPHCPDTIVPEKGA